MTPHQLRDLHATFLLSKGLPLPLVSQRLGHAHSGITAQINAHALKGQDDEAAKVIQGVFERR